MEESLNEIRNYQGRVLYLCKLLNCLLWLFTYYGNTVYNGATHRFQRGLLVKHLALTRHTRPVAAL